MSSFFLFRLENDEGEEVGGELLKAAGPRGTGWALPLPCWRSHWISAGKRVAARTEGYPVFLGCPGESAIGPSFWGPAGVVLTDTARLGIQGPCHLGVSVVNRHS